MMTQRKVFELVIERYQNGKVKRGTTTLLPDVAARWQALGNDVVEHLEGEGMCTPDVMVQIEAYDDPMDHDAWLSRHERGEGHLRIPKGSAVLRVQPPPAPPRLKRGNK